MGERPPIILESIETKVPCSGEYHRVRINPDETITLVDHPQAHYWPEHHLNTQQKQKLVEALTGKREPKLLELPPGICGCEKILYSWYSLINRHWQNYLPPKLRRLHDRIEDRKARIQLLKGPYAPITNTLSRWIDTHPRADILLLQANRFHSAKVRHFPPSAIVDAVRQSPHGIATMHGGMPKYHSSRSKPVRTTFAIAACKDDHQQVVAILSREIATDTKRGFLLALHLPQAGLVEQLATQHPDHTEAMEDLRQFILSHRRPQ